MGGFVVACMQLAMAPLSYGQFLSTQGRITVESLVEDSVHAAQSQ